ncbi:hypothetical protein [Okeania sp. KiyG1]|uniref:hypothetical protein n=1 Tax=Okeania sp. KiyG1 TaxID=2720165 RepID=UPI0019240664|nr:hypothetical protein [Okeania sp. KiyG1]
MRYTSRGQDARTTKTLSLIFVPYIPVICCTKLIKIKIIYAIALVHKDGTRAVNARQKSEVSRGVNDSYVKQTAVRPYRSYFCNGDLSNAPKYYALKGGVARPILF